MNEIGPRLRIALVALVAVLASPASGQPERRQLGAHQHGHGTMSIAIDGPLLIMELDVPAADILGFEHAPATAEEKAAAEQALAALRDPLSLFTPPAGARCQVQDADVALEPDPAAGHADFHAEYSIACATPGALTNLVFAFFDRFRGAEALAVDVVTSRRQARFDVTRAAPRLDLGRLN